MKYERNKKLIVYVITYKPKSTRSPLGDTVHLKDSSYLKFQKSSATRNIPLQNSPSPIKSGGLVII